MLPRPVFENYVLEVVSRTSSVEQRSQYLQAQSFISEAPIHFARAISGANAFLREAILNISECVDWSGDPDGIEDDLKLIRNADQIVRQLYGAIVNCCGSTVHDQAAFPFRAFGFFSLS